jgi:hypothetical protein
VILLVRMRGLEPPLPCENQRSRIFLLGAAGEQEENGLGASASGPARTLTQNVPLGSRVVSQKVNFLGQGNKGGSSRLPLGEERANILLLACCYQEGSNPGLNVWYELGFAIANGKPLVMICDIKARTSQFPFDVSHRPIITFVPESPRDFQALQAEITSRLRALLDATNRTQTMATIKSSETISGLSPHEMAALQIVMENHSPTAWEIKELMVKAGFTKLAGALSLQLLQDRQFVEEVEDTDNFGNPFTRCNVTRQGVDWLLANQNLFQLRRQPARPPLTMPRASSFAEGITDDDVPF